MHLAQEACYGYQLGKYCCSRQRWRETSVVVVLAGVRQGGREVRHLLLLKQSAQQVAAGLQ